MGDGGCSPKVHRKRFCGAACRSRPKARPSPVPPGFAEDLREECDALSADGFRVLGVAYRDLPTKPAYSKEDETDLVLIGYVAFLDPPKDTARAAIAALREHGVHIKILTGDNELVTRTICKHVGLRSRHVLLGKDIARLNDAKLAEAVEKATVFARLSPTDKERIIQSLRAQGHVVGFMGDGINDAAALRAADVGISVDTAVDVAKESADIILLEKSLLVLAQGVLEGRKVFSNVLKYIRMGASSNFGNMFSVIGASALLPFVPMAPHPDPDQQPALRLLTGPDSHRQRRCRADRPTAPLGHQRHRPLHRGHRPDQLDLRLHHVRRDVLRIPRPDTGPRITLPDRLVRGVAHDPDAHHPRHPHERDPVLARRASWPLIVTTASVMAIGLWLPVSPFAPALGFVALPTLYWPILAATLLSYVLLTQLVKVVLLRRQWI